MRLIMDRNSRRSKGVGYKFSLFFVSLIGFKLSEYISIYLFMAWFFDIMVTAGILNFMMLCQSQWP